MDTALLIDRVLDDEGLTSGLDEEDASLLVQLLIQRVRDLALQTSDDVAVRRKVEVLCRHARRVAEVVATFRAAGEATARTTSTRHGLTMPDQVGDPATPLRSMLSEPNVREV